MQRRFKGVICCGENVSFPQSVVYEGTEYPVLASSAVTTGEYLLALLDTAGDPMSVSAITIRPNQFGTKETQSRHRRIYEREPVVRMTYLRTDLSLKVPGYLDPRTMRLVGLHLRTIEGPVYVPLKHSPYNRFQPKLEGDGYVMATNKYVTSEMESVFNIQLTATIEQPGTMVVKGMPVNIVGVVFEGDINYSPSLYYGVASCPTEIALLNLDTNNYEEVDSIIIYNGRPYSVKPYPLSATTLVIAFSGKPRESHPHFAMLVSDSMESVLPTSQLMPFSFKE